MIKLLSHLANVYGWTEDCMMEMSLSRLLLYYTASFDLPYIIQSETIKDGNQTTETIGNKTIKKRKEGLWEITETTIKN